MKNWRPIVLNCAMSKILERIINHQIQDYLKQFQLSSPYQHAYQTAKSYSTALLDMHSFIQSHRNEKKVTRLCLTDQSAAFNVIDLEILVGKLEILGFSSTACKSIRDYLPEDKHVQLSTVMCPGVLLHCAEVRCRRGFRLGPSPLHTGTFLCGICSYKHSCLRKLTPWVTEQNLKKIVESLIIS